MTSAQRNSVGERPVLVWFRNDLRLADNPALHAATASGAPLFCFFIHDEESPGLRPLGGASKWWLHHSLASFTRDLHLRGAALHLFHGPARSVVAAITAALEPAASFWNRRYVGAESAIDRAIEEDLARVGTRLETFNGVLLYEPENIAPKAGGYYRVYAPWWRATRQRAAFRAPLPAPAGLRGFEPDSQMPGAVTLEALGLLPTHPDWAGGLRANFTPGEAQARLTLDDFVADGLALYGEARNVPATTGSSRLSPHLRFGEISPVQVLDAVNRGARTHAAGAHTEKFLQEVAWRDFCASLLFHLPDLPTRPFNRRFDNFPFRAPTAAEREAWQQGQTGYPIVDAGMRQLWQTGTMHNRVRMITASFLVKHLLCDWRLGEAWFWDTLCDADAGNNAVNWQWVAGCGPDAAPFFRIFNPVLQGEKFDPEGAYVRRFVPELSGLDAAWIHKPWAAPAAVLVKAGVTLGTNYPPPIVDHAAARARALAAFRDLGQKEGTKHPSDAD